ncbi:hypothetical protein PA08_1346 [Cutibacterium modestum P08]|nr:hypothetical protein PA08_1346 [Cutibacterium modestum P08]
MGAAYLHDWLQIVWWAWSLPCLYTRIHYGQLRDVSAWFSVKTVRPLTSPKIGMSHANTSKWVDPYQRYGESSLQNCVGCPKPKTLPDADSR